MKKSLFMFLISVVLSMLFCCNFTAEAATYGDLTYEVTNGNVKITDCSTSATSVTIPETINGYPVTSIGDRAFQDCGKLTSITFPVSLSYVGYSAFDSCRALSDVYISDLTAWCNITFVKNTPHYVDNYESNPMYYADNLYLNGELVTDVVIPDGVKHIPICAFSSTKLTAVTIPTSVTSIGDYAFYNCDSLTSVNIPDSVTSIGNDAFYTCDSLTSVYLGNSVTSVSDSAFEDCTSLTSIVIPDSVTSIGDHAFDGCTALASVDIGNSVTKIEMYAFKKCTALTSIIVPDSVVSIEVGVFQGCSALEEITLPFVGSNASASGTKDAVFGYIFESTTSYSESGTTWQRYKSYGSPDYYYYIPQSIRKVTITSDTDIPYGAFHNCSFLSEINLSDSVTSIGDYAFENCTGITSITIPDSVTSIGTGAFRTCDNLTEIYYLGGSSDWKKIAIGTENDDLINATRIYNISVKINIEECTQVLDFLLDDSDYIDHGLLEREHFLLLFYTDSSHTHEFDITAPITANVTLYAVYEPILYSHVFRDYNGTVISKRSVPYGTLITAPRDPYRSATAQYSYSFAGWDGYTEGMTQTDGNLVFTAQYNSVIRTYSYKFVDWDNSLIKTDVADYGTVISAPNDPHRNATVQYTYTFTGWDGYTDGMVLTENKVFTAKYSYVTNKYTHKFVDWDGRVIRTSTVNYGTVITPPSNPQRPATAQYTYTFAGWQGFTSGMKQTGEELVFTAKYTSVVNKYTYKFLDYDGTVLKSSSVNYGTTIVPPSNPQRPSTAQHTYSFVGWDGYVSGMTQPGRNLVFTAIYSSGINQYTHRFIDYDGTILKYATVDYGTYIIPPATPNRQNTAQYTYVFTGWDGYTDGMIQTGEELIFTARYDAIINQYTYRFLDDDGTLLKDETADYGTVITPPHAPSDKDPLTFDYWSGFEEGRSLSGNVDFSAVYKYKTYVISVDRATETFEAEYGSVFEIPVPQAENYVFLGYFTRDDGGDRLTDENGVSLAPYSFPHDIKVYAHFEHRLCNKIALEGDTQARIGQSGIVQKVNFATDHTASYVSFGIKFPDVLSLVSYSSVDFEELTEESRRTADGYTYVTFTGMYDYNGAAMPKNIGICATELTFDVSVRAIVGELVVEFFGDAVLAGVSDCVIDKTVPAIINILPAKAEHITISGPISIDAPHTYTAEILPEYTSDKTVIWAVDDESIAQISADGILTPKCNGRVTVIATAADGSAVSAEYSVNVTAYAKLDSLVSDIGVWDKKFDPNTYTYNITVEKNTRSITLTPLFTSGVLRPNGEGIWINGRAKSFDVVNGSALITLNLQNAENLTDSVYTLNISTDAVKGDVTGDKVVNILDLLRLTKYFAGYEVQIDHWCADVNSDEAVNISDLLLLAKYLAGWDVTIS